VLEPGLELRGRAGTWTGSAPMTYAYQWLRCDRYGGHCRMLKGAKTATYTLRKRDLKAARLRAPLRLAVTATNAAGEKTALSKPLGHVARRPPALRVTFTGATLRGTRLTVGVACRAGSAPCAGRVLGQRVSIPAGTTADVVVRRPRVGQTVRVRFRPSRRASGRAVSVRLRVVRETPPTP
jgi:hypothetical protein